MWKEKYLDLILVPSGLLIMLGYHIILPASRGTAFTVITSNTTAATFLASISLTLSSLIGTWVGSSTSNAVVSRFIYGDKGTSISALKYVSVVGFFLISFVSFVNTTRCFVHTNFLLSMPQADVPVEYVEDAVLRAHIFWQVGLRAVYFATNLLMWVFGPIPMFVTSVITVMILRILDGNTKPLHEFPRPTKKELDLILVPSGLLIMLGYHLILLYKCIRHSKDTALVFENHCNKIWVSKIMQAEPASRSTAFTVINSNTTAATFLASISLTLSSLIGTWVGSSSSKTVVDRFIYGDKGASVSALKYVSVVGFFLISFVSFVNTTRCFVHANFLLSMPQADVPVDYVQDAVARGNIFWELGLRAVYFATNLLMWVFGPIPMFVTSVITVLILRILDGNTKPLHEFPCPTKKELIKVEEEISTVAMALI